ncbi:ribonuclease III [Candidatus Gracilibacteria bacterium]|nr:ribonuclease III [Candidatus Gracilibacteria bacterium]MCF7856304.1 ribonuclease III [Candidatus Gracilibacteria bacterium]MCF7896659.1 ribonuclease III [Candidatus Gracilibacteria bacterium]
MKDLQIKLSHEFKNLELLEKAFVHRSFVNENRDVSESNERLEFLGDAVLELITTDFLFHKFPEKPEGELTALRSALVKGETLAEISAELNLGQHLKLSKGEARSGGAEKPYLLANVFEAVLGATYLDGGFVKAEEIVKKYLLPKLSHIIAANLQVDAKSEFQELAQAKLAVTPEYKVLAESGPDHAKTFEMGAFAGKDLLGRGKGSSKQEAEQAAAEAALKKLK